MTVRTNTFADGESGTCALVCAVPCTIVTAACASTMVAIETQVELRFLFMSSSLETDLFQRILVQIAVVVMKVMKVMSRRKAASWLSRGAAQILAPGRQGVCSTAISR